MKVRLVFVQTLNGKITKGDDPEVKHWSSEGDQKYYSDIWRMSELVVLGSNTYNDNIITPYEGRLVVVMTRNPDNYKHKEIPGQIEFTSKNPSELISYFSGLGYELMTVVGGPQVATSFFKENLIDELWLTIEPKLFGKGYNLIVDEPLEIELRLLQYEKINEQGTLITRYAVNKHKVLKKESIK
jgi:dihydrofolate reductase